MYEIKLSKNIIKFLKKQKLQAIVIQLEYCLNLLKKNPLINSLDIKKLRWFENQYRLRVWDYRLLYEIFENELIIYCVEIWSRGDIYK